MKTLTPRTVIAGLLSIGALTMVSPAFSDDVGEDVFDIHGWRIDPADSANPGQLALDVHGWRIEAAPAQMLAATPSPYIGTSLRVVEDGLGFTDPRAGQGDYPTSHDGELGFTDPRPGE